MVILDHLLVIRGVFMLKEDELKQIMGGAITASWISALARGINSIMDLGRSLGSAIRRIQSGKLC